MLKDSGAFDEFANESAMLKALDHKNLVHYFGTYILDGNKYIVTEYLSLGSLHTLIRHRWSILTQKDLFDM
jgi:serine/threonine protein kinase